MNCGWLRTSETPKRGTRPLTARSTSVASRQPSEPPVSSSESAVARLCVSASAAASSIAGPPCRTLSAALTTTTRSVSTSSRATRTRGASCGEPGEGGVGGVVHRHVAMEAASELRGDECRNLRNARTAGEASCDEQGLVAGRYPELLERLDHGRDRQRTLVALHASDRQAGGSTTIVTRACTRRDRLQRRRRRAGSALPRGSRRRRPSPDPGPAGRRRERRRVPTR